VNNSAKLYSMLEYGMPSPHGVVFFQLN